LCNNFSAASAADYEDYPGFDNYGLIRRTKRTNTLKKKGQESEVQGLLNFKGTVSCDGLGIDYQENG
jgi:hypothetical protein